MRSSLRMLKGKLSDAALDRIAGLLMRSATRRTGRAPFGPDELKLVIRALRSQHLGGTNGKMGAAFESAFAVAYGVPFAVASTSGTAAVHVALGALDLNPGDEIITGPITDMGTIIPIMYQNAIPVFADIDDTYSMDPQDVERKITPRTRAIIAVHLFGNPCDMDALVDVARRHGVVLIEDCSQAHQTTYKGKFVGTIGDIGCFSFQQSKPMTTGEGGMTITWNGQFHERMKLFADKGFARKGWGARAYLFHAPNYRMTELVAAVGLAQLQKVQRVVRRRAEMGRRLTEGLAGLPGVVPAPVTAGAEHTYWLYPIRVTDREMPGLAAALKEAKIPHLPGYTGKPIYLCSESLRSKKTYGDSQFPFSSSYESGTHEYREGLCPRAEALLEQMVCIQWDESWSSADVDRVDGVVRRWLTATGHVTAPSAGASSGPAVPVRASARAVPADGTALRIGIIGAGRVGEWHLRAYRDHTRARVVAVADVDYDRAKAMAGPIGAMAYRSHREMLDAASLDGASICTVPASHREIAIDLATAGVHILCEKPLAVTESDLETMIERARAAGRHLIPAFKFRFHEEIERVKELLATQSLGRILNFRVMFGGRVEMGGTWYVRPELSGGGVLMDNGPHAVDLIRHLFGEIDQVMGKVTESQAYGVEDTVTLMVHAVEGPVGTVDLSWATAVPSRTYLEIFGERGAVLADPQGITYRYGSWADWKRVPNRTAAHEAFSRQIGHFVDVISGRRLPLVTPDDGLRVQRLIEAAYGAVRPTRRGGEAVHA